MSKTRILIGGDICPVNRYAERFRSGDRNSILGPLDSVVSESDLFIANLECPFIESPSPILKTGPALGVSTDCARGLKALGVHALSLANNHSMDHGPDGLQSTLKACRSQGISVFGAGQTLAEAQQIWKTEVNGLRIGVLGMAEREWSIAEPRRPGANPIDIATFIRTMRQARTELDVLIVLLHAGAEGYELPSPNLQATSRFLVEEGAHLVVSQHSHCVGTYEFHQGQLIVYGQGNFIFDYPTHGRKGQHGVLISLDIEANGRRTFAFHPFRQKTHEAGITDVPDAEGFLRDFEMRSSVLQDEDMVAQRWVEFCDSAKTYYFFGTLGYGAWRQRLARIPRFNQALNPAYQKRLLGMLQNETHLELLRTSLRRSLHLD